MQPEDFFSPDYETARVRFRSAADCAGAERTTLPLATTGPEGRELTIDIAWIGERSARRVLLHTSGLHGVEAFAGSAVQLAALSEPPALSPACALVLVHVLNPYGMAWLRRTNENNVDLNRNFLMEDEHSRMASARYAALDTLLNPQSPPARDGFRLRLAGLALRHGPRPLARAIAEGQYSFPRGLFYGGSTLQPGPAAYLGWVGGSLHQSDYLLAIDFHTGLGKWGKALQMLEPGAGVTPVKELSAAFGRPVIGVANGAKRAYYVRGGMGGALPRKLPRTRIDFVLQEIGTYGPLKVLRALRNENRWYHYGTGDLRHPAKLAALEAFCPASPVWRRQALAEGLALLHAGAAWTFKRH